MNTLVKICGITTKDDAEMVLSFSDTKPEYLGFVFFEKSKRYISPEKAKEIVEYIQEKYKQKEQEEQKTLSNRVKFVGVFVNENLHHPEILEHYSFLDVLQLHGDNSFETPEFCIEVQKNVKKLKNINTIDNKKIEIWKAFRVQTKNDLEHISEYFMVDTVLVDAFSEVSDEYGGSGKQVSRELLPYLKSHISLHQKLFIAGGINAENKDEVVQLSGADGIDLSSSVEISAGKKCREKVWDLLCL